VIVVVDTSVWIDFFRGATTSVVERFVALVDDDAGIAITDVILTEILQGLRSEADVRRVERRLSPFEVLRLEELDDFRRAAALYRSARRKGITIRRTLDCLIASVCIREGAALLHADSDFDRLASCSALQLA
jgi:predicted nucleic acid-binding protein